MSETVGFTGTRSLPTYRYADVEWVVKALPKGTRVITGGCVGVDDYVAFIARTNGYDVHGIIPSDRSRVAPGWEDVYTTYEEMPPGTDYRARNERIVELSDRLIAIPEAPEDDPRSRRSGTWMTVRIARRAGKPVQVELLAERRSPRAGAADGEVESVDETAVRAPTVTKIGGGTCDWAMTGRDGYQYPHGIKARRRVENAGEFLDGDFCIRHAKTAVEWAERGIEPI